MSNDKASAAYYPDQPPTPLVQPPARPTPTQDAVNNVLQREGFGSRDEQFKHSSNNQHINRARAADLNMGLYHFERVEDKHISVAFPWLLFFVAQGAHLFYLGRPGKAIAYIFTLGFFGIAPCCASRRAAKSNTLDLEVIVVSAVRSTID